MALATPRRMWISSGVSWARLNSWFRRGINFFGASGSRKPISTSDFSQCCSMPETALASANAGGRANPGSVSANPPSALRHSYAITWIAAARFSEANCGSLGIVSAAWQR